MGLDDFLSLGGHLFVPFIFHEVTSLHSHIPLHFREMIFLLVPLIFQLGWSRVCTSIDHANGGSCSCNQTTMIGILWNIE